MDMEDAIKRLGQATVGAVRAANELPSGRDYALHRSTFTEFQTRVAGPKGSGKAQKRVLALLDRIFTQIHGEPSNYARQKGVEADDVFETVVDFADGRLEAVDVLMDEMAGRAPIIKAGIVGGSMYGGGTGKGGKFAALIRGKPEDLGLAKPQLLFKDPVDNSNDTSFAPKAWPKVYAVSESKSSAVSGRHPYAAEMEAVKYTEHQLTPPGDIQEPRPIQETPFTFVDSLEGLEAMHSVLLGCPEIAVDLEHHSVRSFQGFVCLMQISTREQDFIVDTLALRANMHVLLPAFTDPSITKVFHGADMDVRWLEQDFGLYVVNLFDTGQAARVLQLPSFALAYLLDRFSGQTPDKKFQLADWRLRPLSEQMLLYARMDTHFLLHIYDKLRELLRAGDCGGERLLRSVLSSSIEVAQHRYQKPLFTADSHLLVLSRSGRVMSPQQTAVFAALFAWRDRLARSRDESCDFVLPTSMLFKLAVSVPKSRSSVLDACKPNVPPLLREQVEIVTQLCVVASRADPSAAAHGGDGLAAHAQDLAGSRDASYSLAGWVEDEDDAEHAMSSERGAANKRRPDVHLHPSNAPAPPPAAAAAAAAGGAISSLLLDKSLSLVANLSSSSPLGALLEGARSLFLGRKTAVLLPSGVLVSGGGVLPANAASEEDSEALAKVARILAAFTAEFPQALFVAVDDDLPSSPQASAANDAGVDGMEEEDEVVQPMRGAGLEEDGMPRSVMQVFKGPGRKKEGKAKAKEGEEGEEGGEGGEDKSPRQGSGATKRKIQGEWKEHLRSKLGAEGQGVDDEGGGEGGGEGEGEGREEFRPFDYAAVNADAEPKSKQQKKLDAQAMLEGHFNPHAGLDGKSKQVKAQRRAKPAGKSFSSGSGGGGGGGGGGGTWPKNKK